MKIKSFFFLFRKTKNILHIYIIKYYHNYLSEVISVGSFIPVLDCQGVLEDQHQHH